MLTENDDIIKVEYFCQTNYISFLIKDVELLERHNEF